jgi:hypothetical protein
MAAQLVASRVVLSSTELDRQLVMSHSRVGVLHERERISSHLKGWSHYRNHFVFASLQSCSAVSAGSVAKSGLIKTQIRVA